MMRVEGFWRAMSHWAASTFDWRPLAIVATASSLVFFAIDMSPAFDILTILYMVIVAPLIVLVLVVAAVRYRRFVAWLLPMIFCLVSWACFTNAILLREHGRWLLMARHYKANFLSQKSIVGELKHIEWDGWGFAGSDTTVYLVFDPADSLKTALRSKGPVKPEGLPCEVPAVNRLERYWYSVVFYTNTGWNDCG